MQFCIMYFHTAGYRVLHLCIRLHPSVQLCQGEIRPADVFVIVFKSFDKILIFFVHFVKLDLTKISLSIQLLHNVEF